VPADRSRCREALAAHQDHDHRQGQQDAHCDVITFPKFDSQAHGSPLIRSEPPLAGEKGTSRPRKAHSRRRGRIALFEPALDLPDRSRATRFRMHPKAIRCMSGRRRSASGGSRQGRTDPDLQQCPLRQAGISASCDQPRQA
jgi:hypothetical protein